MQQMARRGISSSVKRVHSGMARSRTRRNRALQSVSGKSGTADSRMGSESTHKSVDVPHEQPSRERQPVSGRWAQVHLDLGRGPELGRPGSCIVGLLES